MENEIEIMVRDHSTIVKDELDWLYDYVHPTVMEQVELKLDTFEVKDFDAWLQQNGDHVVQRAIDMEAIRFAVAAMIDASANRLVNTFRQR